MLESQQAEEDISIFSGITFEWDNATGQYALPAESNAISGKGYWIFSFE